jgi:hypothetical protein
MAGSIFGDAEADGKSRRIRLAFILVYLTGGSLAAAASPLAAADWPQWRGPSGTGTTAETGLPVRWSATENVAWKTPFGGLGVSSPIVVVDRVFVTSQLGAGIRQPGNHPRLVQGGNAAEAGELMTTCSPSVSGDDYLRLLRSLIIESLLIGDL